MSKTIDGEVRSVRKGLKHRPYRPVKWLVWKPLKTVCIFVGVVQLIGISGDVQVQFTNYVNSTLMRKAAIAADYFRTEEDKAAIQQASMTSEEFAQFGKLTRYTEAGDKPAPKKTIVKKSLKPAPVNQHRANVDHKGMDALVAAVE